MNREEELLDNVLEYLWEVINDESEYIEVLDRIDFTAEEIKAYGGLE